MKLVIMFIATLFMFNVIADEPMLKESQFKYVAQSIGKGKPYFLEVGSDRCYSCQKMGRLLYKVVQKNPEYNIYFINVAKNRVAARMLGIQMIPTQIIYDKNGKEVYRHIGILSTNQVNSLLQKYSF